MNHASLFFYIQQRDTHRTAFDCVCKSSIWNSGVSLVEQLLLSMARRDYPVPRFSL